MVIPNLFVKEGGKKVVNKKALLIYGLVGFCFLFPIIFWPVDIQDDTSVVAESSRPLFKVGEDRGEYPLLSIPKGVVSKKKEISKTRVAPKYHRPLRPLRTLSMPPLK